MKYIIKTAAVFILFVIFASAASAQKAPAKPAADINKSKTDIEVTNQVLAKNDDIKSEELQKKAAAEVKKTTSAEYKLKPLPETFREVKEEKKRSEELAPQMKVEPMPAPKLQKQGS